MADEQYRWLDRETAERLLSGESLEAVDAADRDQAERLAKTLGSLSVEPAPISAELPGEAAALAAFRSARAERDDAPATLGHAARPEASDVGLVRIGGPAQAFRRPRWARPVRLGLAAALAAGMIGGVAVAAGTGALPTPFHDDEPRPGASVSATPERPLISPSPDNGVVGVPSPDGDTNGSTGGAPSKEAAPGGPATDRGSTEGREAPSGGRWKGAPSACRDVRDGKQLTDDRRRALEGAAGGPARVQTYCKGVLADTGTSTAGQGDHGKGDTGGGESDQGGKGSDDEGHHPGQDGNGNGNANGGGQGNANSGGSGNGNGGGKGKNDAS
ncbi:hypothetical protein [Streptomyces dysideae]|uniref:Extensin n=1 Tax=Streptomyces dysideae TaxID=909626 RepID=A0A117S1N4_9ACTN|nr:hypothetical protein [Streptomyces dysideae]KUO21667.1 hypothetical protein AQJ91_07775 [Streptomyces dysideae]